MAGFRLKRVIGFNRHAEGLEHAARQAGAVIDGAQAQGAGVMYHQPGPFMRHPRKLGQGMFEKADVAACQGTQDQRRRQASGNHQVMRQALRIEAGARLVGHVDRGAFLRGIDDFNSRFRRNRMLRDQLFAQGRADDIDEALTDRNRQGLAIDQHAVQHFRGAKTIHDAVHAALGKAGVVVGASDHDRFLDAVIGQGQGDDFSQGIPLGDGDLTHRTA